MDAVEGVAGGVFADAGGVRRDVVGAAAEAAFAGEVGGRRLEVGEVDDRRVDEDLLGFAEGAGAAEDAEGVDRGDGKRAPLVEAAAEERGGDDPVAGAARRDADNAAGAVAGRPEGSSTSSQIFGRKAVLRTSMTSRASWPTWAREVRRSASAWRLRVFHQVKSQASGRAMAMT